MNASNKKIVNYIKHNFTYIGISHYECTMKVLINTLALDAENVDECVDIIGRVMPYTTTSASQVRNACGDYLKIINAWT